MLNNKFNLKRVLTMSALLVAGYTHAQEQPEEPILTITTGTTHCTTTRDDCTLAPGGKISVTFTITVGDLVQFTAGDFRTRVELYRGDWTSQGLAGHIVTNATVYPTPKQSPTRTVADVTTYDFSTLSFFSTVPEFNVTKNGTYRAKTILQQLISGTWTDVFTTPLSPIYGAVDQPPYTPYGDMDEVAFIENLKIGTDFNYSVNGLYQAVPAFLTIATCTASPLTLKNITGTMGNPGSATLTIEKGSLSGNTFTASTFTTTTFGADNTNDINLTIAPFSLGGYIGPLRITYRLPDDVCNGVATQVSKSFTISVVTAAFLNDYLAPTGSAVVTNCSSSAQTKSVSSTWSITATMPSSPILNTFKCDLKTAIGWQGATSAGIKSLTYAGNYLIQVYEVSPTTGTILPGAPFLYLKSGSSASNDAVTFGDASYSAGFDPSNPPFFVDPNAPANAFGEGLGYNYFHDFYEAARTNSVTVGNLTSFSARVFCAEVNQYPAGGCVVSKKSYFRIANNGTSLGSTIRMSTSDDDETNEAPEYMSLDVFPNPTTGIINIPVSADDKNVQVTITDNLGKQVIKTDNLESNHGELNMDTLPAGIYFYNVIKNNTSYKGKIVKH